MLDPGKSAYFELKGQCGMGGKETVFSIFFKVLGMEPRGLHIVGKSFSSEFLSPVQI